MNSGAMSVKVPLFTCSGPIAALLDLAYILLTLKFKVSTPGILSRQLMPIPNMPDGSGLLVSIVDISKSQLKTTSNGSPCRLHIWMALVCCIDLFSE